MSRLVRKAAVLGAGSMGSRIAAHLANAGVDVLLLDLDEPTVTRLFDAMQKARPPALFTPATAGRIETGAFPTFDDFFEAFMAQFQFLADQSIEYN